MQVDFDNFNQLIAQNKFEQAINYCNKQLEKNQNIADLLGLRAVAKFHAKDISCIDDLNKAITLEPKNPYRYSSRAYIIDILGNTEAAIEDYLFAIELDPTDHIAINNLGMLEEKMGRKALAKSRFDKVDELQGIQTKDSINFPQPSSSCFSKIIFPIFK